VENINGVANYISLPQEDKDKKVAVVKKKR
jgi:hypothetical protein